ncbi:hypothetical protein ACFQDD_08080 [Halorubrum pallidum]|uniref:Uncharacterized protein n=1 Tax=Halorubrum pallidum TaxID=1526114 RepID=A0ABD5T419_9EURY
MASTSETTIGIDEVEEALDTDLTTADTDTVAGEVAREELAEQREWLAERLEGRGDSLRKSMPDTDADNGLSRYVCRMAHFHAGVNTSMPVTASFDLQDWVDEQGIDASVSGLTDDAGEEIAAMVDMLVDDLLINHFEIEPTGAAREWKGLL